MNVWILQTGEPLHCDGQNTRGMRAINLANSLTRRGHSVIIWSSDFYHQEKRKRYGRLTRIRIDEKLAIILIPSTGYKKNVGVGRLIDHAALALNLLRELRKIGKNSSSILPDIAFIGYPPIETAYIMQGWLRKRNIPTVVDVKDLWPQIFIDAIPNKARTIGMIAMCPYAYLARKTLKRATLLSSITRSFLDDCLAFSGRKREEKDSVLYLTSIADGKKKGINKTHNLWWENKGVSLEKGRTFVFIGTLSRAYDFRPLKEAVERIATKNPEIQVVICGSGEEFDNVKTLFSGLKNVIMPGWVNSHQAMQLMDVAVGYIAPYRSTKDFRMSIPNKIIDSLCSGVPVITSLRGEVEKLIKGAEVGLWCDGSIKSWQEGMQEILSNKQMRDGMSVNCRKIYQERFDGKVIYENFAALMEEVADGK